MDAVELPLPGKVEFGKILALAAAAAVVEGASTGGGGGGGEVLLRRCAEADRQHGADVKQQNQNAESYPSYRSKKTSLEVSMQKSFALGFKYENSVKRDYLGNDTVQSLHKHDSKIRAKKTIKLLDGPPCSKRPKLEPVQTVRDTEAKRHDSMSQKNVPELLQCAPPEKSRLLKQKRVSDAKRIDKKNVRSGVRSRYDCFSSKTGLANFDSGFSGNSVLGAHGLKSDTSDITDHIENPSLGELLNGTYKYSSLGREKGKRVLHTKDELLVSVRKAVSMLSDIDSYGKVSNLILSPKLPLASDTSCDVKEHCGDTPSSTKESHQINVLETALRRPKDILSCLKLPEGQDLDSLLSPGGESSNTIRPDKPSVTAHGASLPPFPWSHSQSGGHRPSVDSSKHGSTRSGSQWQWVRVGSSLTLDDEDSSVHKIGHLLQEMDALKLSIMDSYEGQYNLCATFSTPGSLVQNIHSRKSGNSLGSQQWQYLENDDLSDGFQKHGNGDSLLRTPQASPRTLHAAEILCDMKRNNELWIAQGNNDGAIKWPKSPSEKLMKAHKRSSPFVTAESSSGSRNSDAARNGRNQSSKKIVDRKDDSAHMSNPGKGSIRWPVPIEGIASPGRSERGSMLDSRQTHGKGGRFPSHMSSQGRLEKEDGNQRKLRKATSTSLGSAGDWNREKRNRRM